MGTIEGTEFEAAAGGAVRTRWHATGIGGHGRRFRFRVVALSALVVGAAGCVAATSIGTDTRDEHRAVEKRLVLADFEGPSWKGPSPPLQIWTNHDPAMRVEAAVVPAVLGNGRGEALRISHHFSQTERGEGGVRIALGGIDATVYDHLELRIRGEGTAGFPRAVKIGFWRPHGARPGLIQSGSFVISGIEEGWQQVRVPLKAMNGISEWTDLTRFVITLDSRRSPVSAGAILVDDIALVRTGKGGPSAHDPVEPVRKRAWETALNDPGAVQREIRGRLGRWPERVIVKDKLPADDDLFLRRVARDTWLGLDAFAHRDNGLPVDTVVLASGAETPNGPEAVSVRDYTSPTNIAVYLLATLVAEELGFIGPDEALARVERVLGTLETLESYNGFLYNYYDTTSLERTSNFISSLDSAWLIAALAVMRTAKPALTERITPLIERADFGWLYDDVEQLLSQGYYVNIETPSEYHYGLIYTEARLASLVAIGKGDVPAEHWFKMMRTLPADETWQSLAPRNRVRKPAGRFSVIGGYYERDGCRYVPSWGGSMFEALMPSLLVHESSAAPRSLGVNNRVHTAFQIERALKHLNYPVWGMSPSASVSHAGYGEYGVWYLGAFGYGDGLVTPHASALALSTFPTEAIANLRRLVDLYDIYGEYGFYDAADPISGRVVYRYLALDQGMILISIANYLSGGVVHKHFAADPIGRTVLPLLALESFFGPEGAGPGCDRPPTAGLGSKADPGLESEQTKTKETGASESGVSESEVSESGASESGANRR
ncbi:MAG: glucoamylase family protein [Defluviicoccus sp.]